MFNSGFLPTIPMKKSQFFLSQTHNENTARRTLLVRYSSRFAVKWSSSFSGLGMNSPLLTWSFPACNIIFKIYTVRYQSQCTNPIKRTILRPSYRHTAQLQTGKTLDLEDFLQTTSPLKRLRVAPCTCLEETGQSPKSLTTGFKY